MSISGKYQLEKNCHFTEHLVALGVTEDKAKIGDSLKPILEIEVEGDKLTLTTQNGEYRSTSELIFDKEVNETVAMEVNLKSIAKRLDENTIEIQSKASRGDIGRRRLEFSEHNMIMTIENDSKSIPVAKRYYSRIED